MSYGNNNFGGGGGGYNNNFGGGGGFNRGPQRGGWSNSGGGGFRGRSFGNHRNAAPTIPPVDFNTMTYEPATETAYKPTKIRTGEEVHAWMDEHTVTMYGENVPQPLLTFEELTAAPQPVQRAFTTAGYTNPSCIQSAAWPILLSQRDFVGVAKTGSGKTLGFMVPAVLNILNQRPLQFGDGPIALVLAPTRELAVQIETESKKIMQHLPQLRSTCIYGGVPKYTQMRALRMGVHVCIATPGRLNDMLTGKCTNLLRVSYLVLDEADRMLDMGFEPQIRQIIGQISPERQTVMFSATWPEEIRALAASFQKNFIRVHVGSEKLLANSDVKQHFAILKEEDKIDKMLEVMKLVGRRRILVFAKTKKTADMLWSGLCRNGFEAMCIHGDKDQGQRDRAIERFKMNPFGCLVATDVAARGLDIKQLEIVINFDFPTNIEDYVHRIGRTGRAGAKGDAYTFLTTDMSSRTVRDLIDLLKRSQQAVPNELFALASSGGGGGGGRFGNRRSFNSAPVPFTPIGMFLGGDDGTPFSASCAASPVTGTVAPLPTPAAAAPQSTNSYNNNNGYNNNNSYNNNSYVAKPAVVAAPVAEEAPKKAEEGEAAPHGDYNFRKRPRVVFTDSDDE